MAQFFMLKLLDGEGFNVLYKVALIFGLWADQFMLNVLRHCFTGLKSF